MSEPLTRRVLGGLAWTAGSFGVVRLFGLIQTVVLARLLAPSEFGLAGIALLTTSTLASITNLGIRDGIMRSEDGDVEVLDAALFLAIVRGLALFAVVQLIAAPVASFFGDAGAEPLLRVAGFSPLIHAFQSPGPALFAKALDYRRSAFWSRLPGLLAIAATASLAFLLRDARAIVWGGVAAAAATAPLTWWAHDYRPRWRFPRAALRDLWRHGSKLLGAAPLFELSNVVDDVAIGRWFGPRSLGLYRMAYGTAAIPATWISDLALSVLFPAFARVRGDPATLSRGLLRALRMLAAVTLPICALLATLAPDLVGVVYGDAWRAAAPILAAFAIYAAARSVVTVAVPVFRALGRTEVVLEFAVVNLAVVALLALVVAPYGPVLLAWAMSGVSIPLALYGLTRLGRVTAIPTATLFATLRPGALAAAAVLVVCLLGPELVFVTDSPVARLLVFLPAAGFAVLSTWIVWSRETIDELRDLAAELARGRDR